MKRTLNSVLAWSRTHQGKKLSRFAMTSVITTAISFTAVATLYGFRVISSVILATLAGNFIGTFPAYHLNRRWTWGKRGRSHLRLEILPFWTMSFLGIAFSQFGAFFARDEVRTHHWSHLLNTGLVAGINLASFAIFWFLKLMVFNRIFKVDPLEALDEHLTIEEKRVG